MPARFYPFVVLLAISSIFALNSCNQVLVDDANYRDLDTLHIADSLFAKSLSVPINAESLCYIKLETNKYSLIRRIDQIEIHDGIIYVLDTETNRLLLFKLSGKHIKSISIRSGRLQHFDVNKEGLFVLEKKSAKIYRFSRDGKLLGALNAGFHGAQFAVLNAGGLIYNTVGLKTADRNSEQYQLALYDADSVSLKLPYREGYAGLRYTFGNQFFRLNGELNFLSAFSNILYRLNSTDITAVAKFDFGKYNMPDSVFLSRSKYSDYNRAPFVTNFAACGNSGSISFYRFAYESKGGYLLVDHKSNEVIDCGIGIIAGPESDFNDPAPVCSYQGKFVALVEASMAISTPSKAQSRLARHYDLSRVSATDNPFLMLYSLL